jgi:hypothetical protein
MNKDTDFEGIGRKSLYKVPDGFFEQVSEKTLRKAKQREQNHRKIQVALLTFAVAASLSAIALLGYFMLKTEQSETKQIVQDKQTEVRQEIPQTEVISKQITLAGTKKVTPVKTATKESRPEEIADVLADLSDDELLELAAVYKSDPFIEESQQ